VSLLYRVLIHFFNLYFIILRIISRSQEGGLALICRESRTALGREQLFGGGLHVSTVFFDGDDGRILEEVGIFKIQGTVFFREVVVMGLVIDVAILVRFTVIK